MPTNRHYVQIDNGVVTGEVSTPGEFDPRDLPAGRVVVEVDPVANPPRDLLRGSVTGLRQDEKVVRLTDDARARLRFVPGPPEKGGNLVRF